MRSIPVLMHSTSHTRYRRFIQVKNTHAIYLRFLINHGIMLLCLGAGLSLLAELMTNQGAEKWAYIACLFIVVVALCEPIVLSIRSMWFKKNSKRFLKLFIFSSIAMLAASVALWGENSKSTSFSVILILAGVMGLFWGTWHIEMAHKLSSFSKTSTMFTVLGATTSVSGVILCVQADIHAITAVTAVACYSTWIGVEMLMMAPVLFWDWRCGATNLAGWERRS